MKNIFLTGATGFIGSHIAANLINSGAQLKLLVRSKEGKTAEERIDKIFKQISPDNVISKHSFEIIQGDITSKNITTDNITLLGLKNNIDEVWHCAAFLKKFDDAYASEIQRINIDGTKNMLDFAVKVGANRFHHISTAYICGNTTGKIKEIYMDAGSTFKNLYERSKFEAEQLVRKYGADYGIPFTIYRPSIVIGNSQTGTTSSYEGYYFFARWFYLLRKKILKAIKSHPGKYAGTGITLQNGKLQLPIRIPCSNNQTVNLVNIDYVARTIVDIAASGNSMGEVFHLTNPHPPACNFLFEESLRFLGIEGCNFVEVEEFYNSSTKEPLIAEIEENFVNNCKTYFPYIVSKSNVEFDNSNVKKVLAEKYTEPPTITREILETILSYAIIHNFKLVL